MSSTLLAVIATLIMIIVWAVYSRYSFRRGYAAVVANIEETAAANRDTTIGQSTILQLPEPVQRYFNYAAAGQKRIAAARIYYKSKFRTAEYQKWRDNNGEKVVTSVKPEYAGVSVVEQAPFLPVFVRDTFSNGQANTVIKIHSFIPVASIRSKEATIAAMVRYIAEAPWLPTTLLPGNNLKWTAVDSQTAKAEMTSGDNTITAVFTFNQAGQIVKATTEDNYRELNGRVYKERWSAFYSEYTNKEGVNIPARIEAVWNLPNTDFNYAVYELTAIKYLH